MAVAVLEFRKKKCSALLDCFVALQCSCPEQGALHTCFAQALVCTDSTDLLGSMPVVTTSCPTMCSKTCAEGGLLLFLYNCNVSRPHGAALRDTSSTLDPLMLDLLCCWPDTKRRCYCARCDRYRVRAWLQPTGHAFVLAKAETYGRLGNPLMKYTRAVGDISAALSNVATWGSFLAAPDVN
jgi:hypothetical protein